MNKKFILPIALLLLIGIVGFVYALSAPSTVEVKVFKGWNLISTQAEHYSQSDSLKFSDFKYVYVYDSQNKEYLLLISNGQEIENVEPKSGAIKEQYDKVMDFVNRLRSQGAEQNFASQTAVWVYSEKDGIIKYESESQNSISLNTGWNFVGFTPEMLGKTLNEIKGTCQITQTYFWNPEDKNWGNDLSNERLSIAEGAGYGLVIKVKDSCTLSILVNGENTTPPAIPNLPQ